MKRIHQDGKKLLENGYIKPRKTFWRNSKQLLNCLMKFRRHSNQCLLIAVFPDSIIARRSWLRKPADMGASAHTYKSIRCKIINLQAARLLILQAEDY